MCHTGSGTNPCEKLFKGFEQKFDASATVVFPSLAMGIYTAVFCVSIRLVFRRTPHTVFISIFISALAVPWTKPPQLAFNPAIPMTGVGRNEHRVTAAAFTEFHALYYSKPCSLAILTIASGPRTRSNGREEPSCFPSKYRRRYSRASPTFARAWMSAAAKRM